MVNRVTKTTTTATQMPVTRLAQNFFLLALLALLACGVGTIGLVLSPVSPLLTFATLRLVFIGIMLAVCALGLWACLWSFSASQEALERVSSRLVTPIKSPTVALVALGVAYVVGLTPFFALRDVAPSIVQPLHLSLVGLLTVGVLAGIIYHAPFLASYWQKSVRTWAGLGAIIFGAVVAVSGFIVFQALINASGINNSLRGGFDYRELTFIGENPPASNAFWQEQSQTRVRWLPYSYWVVTPLEGDFINVSPEGLRQTVPNAKTPDAPTIAFFGGSTVWGEGARDPYTIPSRVANRLDGVTVINYGQTGYVSAQDLILFQMQLLEGNIPDVAVFYGGFNDILSAYQQGYSGITLQEAQRLSDSETGRLLRGGTPLLRPLALPLTDADLNLITTKSASAQDIITRYLNTLTMMQHMAEAYGVKTLFVWQPALAFKTPLVGIENVASERLTTERAGLAELHQEANTLLQEALTNNPSLEVVMLNDLFAGRDEAIFYDLIHITEVGNQAVAEALLPHLQRLLQ